jgi:hypothetical protein
LVGDVGIAQATGEGGWVAGVDKTIPNLSLLLNLHQRAVQVSHVNTGSHILFGQGD